MLTDTKDKIVLKSATGIQDPVNPCKETAGEVGERQEIKGRSKEVKGRSKGEESLRAEIEKVDKEYRELLSEYSRLTPKQRASSGKRVQQQGTPGAREQGARAAEAESFRGLPAVGAPRSKIKRVVPSNALARLDIDPPDAPEGHIEDPEKYS